MDTRSKVDFWQFLRMVFVFFLGGTILSMFALQLSPAHRESALELSQLKQDCRKVRSQFEDKDLALRDVEKKLRIISTEAIKRQSDTQAAIVKKDDIKTQLDEVLRSQKDTTKAMARMELEKSQSEKQLALHTAELEKLKKENARLQQLMTTEKKDCEVKTFECEVVKSDAEACKVKYRDVQNEMERLTLEHEQVKKDGEQMTENCDKLKKQLDERDASTEKLIHKVEQADLANLLDGDSANDSASRINKDDIQSLLNTPDDDVPSPAVIDPEIPKATADKEADDTEQFSEDGIQQALLRDNNTAADLVLPDE